jgi:hypothetical protein
MLMLLAATLLLVACQTTGSVATNKSVSCAAFKPILWSKLDTLDTQKQAVEHNAAWSALCAEKK